MNYKIQNRILLFFTMFFTGLYYVGYLVHSHFGLYISFLKGADWSHALALIEAFYNEGSRQPTLASLGDMALYPPISHWLVAQLSHLFQVSPLQMLQMTGAFFILLGSLATAWIYWKDFGNNWLAFIGVGLGLYLTAHLGFGFRGMLLYNFFFPQLVGTAIAVVLFAIFRNILDSKIKNANGYALLFLLASVEGMIFLHSNPALWLGMAGILYMVLKNEDIKTGLIWGGIGLLLLGIIVLQNPYFKNIAMLSQNDGYFGTRRGELATFGLYKIMALLMVTMVTIATLRVFIKIPFERKELAKYSVLIAVVGLVFAQWGACLLNFGSPYAVKKWLPWLGIWSPYLCGYFFETIGKRWTIVSSMKPNQQHWAIQYVLILILFGCNIPQMKNLENQTRIIEMRNRLIVWRLKTTAPEKYPQFDADRFVNYYYAIGVLAYPRNVKLMQWLQDGTRIEKPLKIDDVH